MIETLENIYNNSIYTLAQTNEIADLFPKEIQITPQYKVQLSPNYYMAKEQDKGSRILVKIPISGELEGGIIAYLDPNDFPKKSIHVLTGLFCETINILSGHFLTNLDADKNIMCSLSHPVIYALDSDKNHNYEYLNLLEKNGVELQSFELNGVLRDNQSTAKLSIQVFYVHKEEN
jgi:hypothetical protein